MLPFSYTDRDGEASCFDPANKAEVSCARAVPGPSSNASWRVHLAERCASPSPQRRLSVRTDQARRRHGVSGLSADACCSLGRGPRGRAAVVPVRPEPLRPGAVPAAVAADVPPAKQNCISLHWLRSLPGSVKSTRSPLGEPALLRSGHGDRRYNMSLSTIIMPCNYSAPYSAQVAARYGVVDLDWSNEKNLWVNDRPADSCGVEVF